MASTTKKSLASRAGAAARKVVSSTQGAATSSSDAENVAEPSVKGATAAEAAPKKVAAKKTSATKAAPAKTTSAHSASTKATEQTPAKKAPATTSKAGKDAGRTSDQLLVLEAEDPWTQAELKEVEVQLREDVQRLAEELVEAEEDLAGMIENPGEGAGNDQADVGSSSFERDQEIIIVNNARDVLEQSQHALGRILDGSYGQCEECGDAIGKNRLMAFPRATLCLTCKQREERR